MAIKKINIVKENNIKNNDVRFIVIKDFSDLGIVFYVNKIYSFPNLTHKDWAEQKKITNFIKIIEN
jgi:hypothetical protein